MNIWQTTNEAPRVWAGSFVSKDADGNDRRQFSIHPNKRMKGRR